MRTLILIVLVGLSGLSAAQAPRADWRDDRAYAEGRDADLMLLLDRITERMLQRNPLWVAPTLGDERYNGDLGAAGPEAAARWLEQVTRWAAEAEAIEDGSLSERDALDLDLIRYSLSIWKESAELGTDRLAISNLSGPQVMLPQLPLQHPFRGERDYRDYLARLREIPRVLSETEDMLRLGMATGLVQPRAAVSAAPAQARAQADAAIAEDPARSPFFRPVASRRADDALRAEVSAVIAERLVPAYAGFAEFLEREYLPAARERVGITAAESGEAIYEHSIRRHTTLGLTADEVHELGLREVARIKSEMMEVIARTDFPRRDSLEGEELFAAFVGYLRTDPRFYFTEASELVAAYRETAKRVDAEMPRLFGLLPRLPYGVREIPLFAAKASPTAYYYPGSLSEGRAGYFMANTYQLDQRPKFDIVALTLHEAVPGHHHQIALGQELEGQHPIRSLLDYTAFVEGWGLYSERLGLEMGGDEIDDGVDRGLYADPYDDFGRLNYEMWRALRLVIDTGIHAKGWTRERAIGYMLANSANTELDTASEVDRYIGWPGQALAYKIGELKIRELRERAEGTLGDRFDLRDFHDRLLEDGALPLPVLEAKIDRWIASRR